MEGQKINASNLVTTLPADVLTPLSSVREAGGRLPRRDRNRQDGRRPPVGDKGDEDGLLSEIVDSSEHRLDRIG
jgi:hypothetical protein